MKLMIGFAAGFAAGAYTYSKMTEEQRAGVTRQLDSMMHRGRSGDIAAAMGDGMGSIADAVTDRVAGAASTVTSAVAEKIDDGESPPVAVGEKARLRSAP